MKTTKVAKSKIQMVHVNVDPFFRETVKRTITFNLASLYKTVTVQSFLFR